MTYLPIHTLKVRDYGCIKSAQFRLSPLHALIGPNDSGKSTALRAIRTAAQFAAGDFGPQGQRRPMPFDPMLDVEQDGAWLSLGYQDEYTYSIEIRRSKVLESARKGEIKLAETERDWHRRGLLGSDQHPTFRALHEGLTKATMVRFDPNALRRSSPQILAGNPIEFFDETGAGLASVYQAINARDVDGFVAVRDEVRKLFPTIQNILVPNVPGPANNNVEVVLQARLIDNTLVPTAALSEGLLYFLGFAALRYLEGSRLFLVEEPENGLHPARISEVMRMLREISKTAQVVIATHSPLVVNELEGHEITVVTRDAEAGTQTKLLKDVPGFEDAAKVYRPGEFWVSYSDGVAEAVLLGGGPRP